MRAAACRGVDPSPPAGAAILPLRRKCPSRGHRAAGTLSGALGYRTCGVSIGLVSATGPALGRSPARLCADASDTYFQAPGQIGPGLFVIMGTRRIRWWW